jgi:hypothetical protein
MHYIQSLFAGSLFDGETFAPLILCLSFAVIPIIAILTRHQRKMVELLHGRPHEDIVLNELASLRSEVSELKTQIRSLSQSNPVSTDREELTRRLG